MEQPSPTNDDMKNARPRYKPARWLKIALIIGSAAMVMAIGLIFLAVLILSKNPAFRSAMKQYEIMVACGSQMEGIGAALNRYELSHDEYPEKLEDLWPDYLASRKLFRCPADSRSPDSGPPSYLYKRPKAGAPGDTIVCRCRRHRIFETQPLLEIRLYKDGVVGQSVIPETGRK